MDIRYIYTYQSSRNGTNYTEYFANSSFEVVDSRKIDTIEEALDFRNTRSTSHGLNHYSQGGKGSESKLMKEISKKGRAPASLGHNISHSFKFFLSKDMCCVEIYNHVM